MPLLVAPVLMMMTRDPQTHSVHYVLWESLKDVSEGVSERFTERESKGVSIPRLRA